MSPQTGEQDVVLFAAEEGGSRELGFEQLRLLFRKLGAWLHERKQDAAEDTMEPLERMRHIYPQAYEALLAATHRLVTPELDQPAGAWGQLTDTP